jgi:hypothetical protein
MSNEFQAGGLSESAGWAAVLNECGVTRTGEAG